MKTPKVHLATSSEELSERARAALSKSGGKTILVPVDFSDHSEAALIQASEFAQTMPTSLMVLHVVHDPGEMPGYYAKLIKKKRSIRMQDIAAEAFQEFVTNVIEARPELTALRDAELLMVIGLPVTRILEVVEQLNPIMVVMGSQGRTGLKNLVIGSKAAQIVQLCPVPVTIVKNTRQTGPD
jgi:nucleotide-binding universal stress UspA family protein